MIPVMHISARSDPGGGPAVIQTIIETIGTPFEHHVASPADPPYGPRFADLVGRANFVEIPHRRWRTATWRQLADHIRRHGIQVLHSHGFGAGLYGRSLAVALQVPVVHSYHGFLVPEHGWLGMLARYLAEAGLALLTTQGVVCSASECAKLRRLLPFPPLRLSVVNNALEITPPRNSETVRPVPSIFSILCIGRLSHQKNPEALVRIAAGLHRLAPALDFRLRLIGDGPKRAAVERLATTLNLGHRIEFLGAVRAGDWLGQADVLLSASRGEGMPLSLLEAMAAGLPIVASSVVGNVDLVQQGETGFLFPPGDLEGAATALVRLANDQPLRHRLGVNASERVRREFKTDQFAASYSAIYRELASRQAHRMEESPAP